MAFIPTKKELAQIEEDRHRLTLELSMIAGKFAYEIHEYLKEKHKSIEILEPTDKEFRVLTKEKVKILTYLGELNKTEINYNLPDFYEEIAKNARADKISFTWDFSIPPFRNVKGYDGNVVTHLTCGSPLGLNIIELELYCAFI